MGGQKMNSSRGVWGKCPECETTNVEPFNRLIVIGILWVIALFLYAASPLFGLIMGVIALITTIASFILKAINKEILKCKECNKFYVKQIPGT